MEYTEEQRKPAGCLHERVTLTIEEWKVATATVNDAA
jgi:hypothetical protein